MTGGEGTAPNYGTGREVHGIRPLLQEYLASAVIDAQQTSILSPTQASVYMCTDTNAFADGSLPRGDLYYGIDDEILDVGALSVYKVTRIDICVIQGGIVPEAFCVTAFFAGQTPGSGFQQWHISLPSVLEIPNSSVDPLCSILPLVLNLDAVWILATSFPLMKGELRECGNQYAIAWVASEDIDSITSAYEVLCDIADVPASLEHSESGRGTKTGSPTYVERSFD